VRALSDPWIIRRVEASDQEALAALSKRLWPKADPGHLTHRWWMNTSPSQCFAAVGSDGAIGGVCGAREQQVFVRGTPARAVGICDWFIDPETRGSGLGRKLADAALREAEVAWSLSLSADAEKAFLKLKFGPDPAHRVPLFLAPSAFVAARHALSSGGGLSVETRDFGHASVDSLADEIEQARAFRQDEHFTGGARGLEAWRSHLSAVPHRTYQAHLLRNDRAELIALAVSRRLTRGAFPRLGPTRLTLLTELLCDLSNRDRLQPLFRRLAVDATRAGSEILFYPAYDPPMHQSIARAGFFSAAASWMGLRIPRLSTRFMTRQSIAPEVGASQWRVTPLDCDYDLAFGDAE
jgi:GNAT superfamily N-acetyltransferase